MLLTGHVLIEPVRDRMEYDRKSPLLRNRFACVTTALPQEKIRQDRQKLYLVTAENAVKEASREADSWFLCIDRENKIEKAPRNLLVLYGTMTMSELLNCLQDRFILVQDWYEKLQHAVLYGASLQQLLDMSENIIGQYIAISDYALRLLAYTKHISCECEVCQDLRKNGVHTGRTLELFRKKDRFRYWSEHEFYEDESHEISRYAICGAVFRFSSTYFNHAVMTMNTPEIDPNAVELFRVFSESIRPLVAKDWEKAELFAHLYDGLITDLIQGKQESTETVETRARYANVPSHGRFMLFVCPLTTHKEYSVGRLGNEINNLSDNSWVVYADREMILLHMFEETGFEEKVQDFSCRVRRIMNKYALNCGVSSLFEHLEELRVAYMQAKYALSVIKKQMPGPCVLKDQCLEEECFRLVPDRLMMFNKVYDFCFIDCSKDKMEMLRTSRYYRSLKALLDYDREHHTNNLQLLRTYLETERRVMETAERMHMHRNNVSYRVQKIQEITKLDLSDPMERFRILETYMIMNKASGDPISLFYNGPDEERKHT